VLAKLTGHPYHATSLATWKDPDSGRDRIASGALGGKIRIWDFEGQCATFLHELSSGYSSEVTSLLAYQAVRGQARLLAGCGGTIFTSS
jgi:WD40 repeat protein